MRQALLKGGSSSHSGFQILLGKAVDGDNWARDKLIERASHRLMLLTRRMFGDFRRLHRWEETDDVFQNAVIRLSRTLKHVRPASERQFFGLAATQIRRTLLDLSRHYFGAEGVGARHQSHSGVLVESARSTVQDGTDLSDWSALHESVELMPRR